MLRPVMLRGSVQRALPIALSILLGACTEPRRTEPLARGVPTECPRRMARIPGLSACIDRHEAVVIEGRAEPATERMPTSAISYEDAEAACRAVGYRLCTGEEWGRACGGEDQSRVHPYGDEHEARRCNLAEDDDDLSTLHVVPSGRFERCVTPEGVFDLAGNVAEWTDEPDGSGDLRELRGGAARNPERYARCQIGDRGFQPTDQTWEGQGFRCCVSR